MSGDSNTEAADLEALQRFATRLTVGIERAIGPWVERSIESVCDRSGIMVTGVVRQRAREAGAEASNAVVPRITELLSLDIDDQRVGPLELIRGAVRFATAVLLELGATPVQRDEMSQSMFPDDVFDLTPGSFGDLDPALQELGIEWGAAKAHVFLARRRSIERPPSPSAFE